MKLSEFAKKLEEKIIMQADEEWAGLLEDEGKEKIHVSHLLKCGLKRYYAFKYPDIVKRADVKSPDAMLGIQFEMSIFEVVRSLYPNAISNYRIEVPFGKKYKLVGRLDIFIPDENLFFEVKKITYPIRLDIRYTNADDDTREYITRLEDKMRTNLIAVDERGVILDDIKEHYREQVSLYKYLSDCQGHFIIEARVHSKNAVFNQRIIIVNADRIEPMDEEKVIHLFNEHLESLEGKFISPRYDWNCWYGNPPKKCIFYEVCENPFKKPLKEVEV